MCVRGSFVTPGFCWWFLLLGDIVVTGVSIPGPFYFQGLTNPKSRVGETEEVQSTKSQVNRGY